MESSYPAPYGALPERAAPVFPTEVHDPRAPRPFDPHQSADPYAPHPSVSAHPQPGVMDEPHSPMSSKYNLKDDLYPQPY